MFKLLGKLFKAAFWLVVILPQSSFEWGYQSSEDDLVDVARPILVTHH